MGMIVIYILTINAFLPIVNGYTLNAALLNRVSNACSPALENHMVPRLT